IGSVMPLKKELDYELKGRDIITGLPRVIKVTSVEIREAILPTVNKILDAIKDAIEYTPPELVSDVIDRGMLLAGGGALIRKIDKYLSEKLKIPVVVSADPMA
ncbi:rod shape-determining protein, partial [Arthrospira platensis SPKY1]|nr:rod shape-determining protein [Arthrospira platensis SPKY1]